MLNESTTYSWEIIYSPSFYMMQHMMSEAETSIPHILGTAHYLLTVQLFAIRLVNVAKS